MYRDSHIVLVQQIYRDFVVGRIGCILARLAEDVEWAEPPFGPPPFSGTYRGRKAVGEFFRRLAEAVEVERFEPREYFARDGSVLALGSYRFRSRSTGAMWETDWAMIWNVWDGKIARCQTIKDSAGEAAGLRCRSSTLE